MKSFEPDRRIHPHGFSGGLPLAVLRGISIWSAGKLPPESPEFSPLLSSDLVSYGLALFELGLELRAVDRGNPATATAFETAGEAIESVIRDGDPEWRHRGFLHACCCRRIPSRPLSARAFSLFPSQIETLNLSPGERALSLLMRRDLGALRVTLLKWAAGGGGFDGTLASRLSCWVTIWTSIRH